eukprot:TRINITY_DN874_c0_g2_i1.p1 TRINITY_DN874_c0_g2~~TRINITY_DN874_c0_g2_i1.p1  ORF type:complete len:233 (-),score=19.12 TRINITY_DN874_c0_g2_i1:1856-2455(-)
MSDVVRPLPDVCPWKHKLPDVWRRLVATKQDPRWHPTSYDIHGTMSRSHLSSARFEATRFYRWLHDQYGLRVAGDLFFASSAWHEDRLIQRKQLTDEVRRRGPALDDTFNVLSAKGFMTRDSSGSYHLLPCIRRKLYDEACIMVMNNLDSSKSLAEMQTELEHDRDQAPAWARHRFQEVIERLETVLVTLVIEGFIVAV